MQYLATWAATPAQLTLIVPSRGIRSAVDREVEAIVGLPAGTRSSALPRTRLERLRLGVVIVTGLATMLVGSSCGDDPPPPPFAAETTPMCTILCDAYDRFHIDGRCSTTATRPSSGSALRSR